MIDDRLLWLCVIGIFALRGFWWGLSDTRRIIEFPFLYSLGLLVFILPQGFAICRNPERVPDEAFYVSVAMILLCTFAVFFGYFGRNSNNLAHPRAIYTINARKLFMFGLILCLIGTAATMQLKSLGEIKEWRGWPVYWGTLSKLNMTGLTMIIVSSVMSRQHRRLWIALLFSIYPAMNIIWGGRRSMIFTLPILYLLPFLIHNQRFRMPRWVAILAVAGACIVVYAIPVWRDRFAENEHLEAIQDIPLGEITEDMIATDNTRTLEVVDGMLLMGAVWNQSTYQYGVVSVYNQIIGSYFPGGLLGRDLKRSLRINPVDQSKLTHKVYGIPVAFYTGKTVYADLFKNFGFFGAIIIFWLARLYRRIHYLAIHYHDGRAILSLCSFIMLPAQMVEDCLFGALVIAMPVYVILLFSFKHCMVAKNFAINNT